jgi:hypothetical protein
MQQRNQQYIFWKGNGIRIICVACNYSTTALPK